MNSFDFVIVGAGIVGCSLALELASNGHSVVVIERGIVGAATSAVNQGGIRQQFFHSHNIRAGAASTRRIRQISQYGIDADFRQNRYLLLLTTVSAFSAAVAAQNDQGVPTEFIKPEEARRIVPRLDIEGLQAACFCPTDGYVDPVRLMRAYKTGASQAGAVFHEATEVMAVDTAERRVTRVHTTRGTIGAGVLVNAAGPWARQFATLIQSDLPVYAHQSSIFVLQPGHSDYAEMPLIIDSDRRVTLCPHSQGGVMVGSANKPRVDLPGIAPCCDWTGLFEVKRRAGYRLSDLATAPVEKGWAGYWEITADDDPIIDFCFKDNYFVCAGFSGHGMSVVPGLARSIACALTGAEPDIALDPFKLSRFDGPARARTEIWGGTAIARAEAAIAR